MDVQYQRCPRQKTRVAPQSFTLAYMEDWKYGRTVTKTKYCSPYFLTIGALRARLRPSEIRYENNARVVLLMVMV